MFLECGANITITLLPIIILIIMKNFYNKNNFKIKNVWQNVLF